MAIKIHVVLLCLLLPVTACAAPDDDDAIATDRPDFVDSPDVVGKGRFQIETGFQRERDTADGVRHRTDTLPMLLRAGVSDDWELRLETDTRQRAIDRDLATGERTVTSGYADLSLGAKWHLRDGDGAQPALGLVGQWDLDTGSKAVRAAGKGGSLRLGEEWQLADDLELGLVQGLAWRHRDDGKRFTSALFGMVLQKDWTSSFSTFVEYAAQQIAHARDGGSTSTFDLGASWLLSKSVQLDTALSRGINRNAPDWSWTAGLSLRF
ncbi:hypothetical protein ASF61_21570 [Duganella sp. Leaf126]|uniref:transporter n=1 Tax=Duganella sp. Leaf126 TaxID=1736266 RepID=UPI0006FCB3D6|nr:transporter [Duganella sp. Leaf126]KQQ44471.1 hypothetical protein ASF61_21570 [Duganella sp. Leaf126]